MSVTGPLYIIMMARLLNLVVKLLRQQLYASRVLFFVLVKSVLTVMQMMCVIFIPALLLLLKEI